MKKLAFYLITFFALTTASAQFKTLEIGERVPFQSYQMRNIDGKTYSIENIAGENGVLVIFTCNSCPFVVGRGEKVDGWEGRYNSIIDLAISNGIGSILVNSNSAKRNNDDSIEAMKNRAQDMDYNVPYVVDEESKLANGFGAKTTPHVFLFDGDFNLIYKGAIDDNVNKSDEVSEHYLINAINRYTDGKRIRKNTTAPQGCSIKRVK